MKRSSAKPDPGEPLLLVSAAAVSPFPCGHEEKPTPSLCGQLGQHAGRSLALVLLWSAVMTQAGLESRRQGRWPSVVTTGNRTTQTIRGHWTLSPNWRDCATWVGHISGQTELAFVAYLCSLSLSLSRSYPHSCHCFCSECIECTSFRFFLMFWCMHWWCVTLLQLLYRPYVLEVTCQNWHFQCFIAYFVWNISSCPTAPLVSSCSYL